MEAGQIHEIVEHVVDMPMHGQHQDISNQNNSFSQREQKLFRGLRAQVWTLFEAVLTIIQVVSAVVVLCLSRDDRLYQSLSTWVIGYATGCACILPLLYWRYRSPDNGSTMVTTTSATPSTVFGISTGRLKVIIPYYLHMVLDWFFMVWLAVGVVWISQVDSDWSKLYILCVLFLVFSCIGHVVPMILLIVACAITTKSDARGGTLEAINSLPTYIFRAISDVSTGAVGVIAEGTEDERSLLGDEAVCSICLSRYDNNDELRVFHCSHTFHKECADRWLHTNATCPLCKAQVCETMWGSLSEATISLRQRIM